MKAQRGQSLIEVGVVLLGIAIIAIAILGVLDYLPKPNFQAAGQLTEQVLQAVAIPQVQVPTYKDHANDRHADVISATVMCFSGYGTMNPASMLRQKDRHHAWMCQMDGGMYIWIVDDFGNTVTQFKNKAKSFDEAVKYLTKQGYLFEE